MTRVDQMDRVGSPTAGDDLPTLVYVAGVSRSGSTLLSFLANSHPDVVSVGEMHSPPFPRDRPNDRMCSCGEPIARCVFFAELARRLESRNIDFDPRSWDLSYAIHGRPRLSRLVFGSLRSSFLEDRRDALMRLVPSYRRKRGSIDRSNDTFLRTALEIAGARAFVDANKDPIRIRYLRSLKGWNLRVIHLVRDPRGYANSMVRDTGAQPGAAAGSWRRINANIERHLLRMPAESWQRLNYETICEDPMGTLHGLAQFMAVRPVPSSERLADTTGHITGNKMAFDFSGQITLDEKWKRNLSTSDIKEIAEQAGTMARRYGYDL